MTAKKPARDQICVRVDREVVEIAERVAAVERRPFSNVIRNALSDWAKSRENENSQVAA